MLINEPLEPKDQFIALKSRLGRIKHETRRDLSMHSSKYNGQHVGKNNTGSRRTEPEKFTASERYKF